jgi:hypothetical protein
MTENMKKHQRALQLLQYRMPHTGRIYNEPEPCDNVMVYLCYRITEFILHADKLLTSARPEWLMVAVTQFKQGQGQHTEKQPNTG